MLTATSNGGEGDGVGGTKAKGRWEENSVTGADESRKDRGAVAV